MNLIDNIYRILWIVLDAATVFMVLGVITYFVAAFIRNRNLQKIAYNLTFLHVKLPKDNELEIKAAEQLFSSLYGFRKSFFKALFTGQYRLSIEIIAKDNGIGFYIVTPDEIAPFVEKQINGAYPMAEIDIVDPLEIWDRGKYTQVEELKLKGSSYYPIKIYEDLKGDSMNSITSAMSKLSDQEALAIQIVIQPATDSWRMAGRRFISDIRNRSANPEKKVNIDTSFLENIEKKINKPGFYTKIRFVSLAQDKLTAESHIQSLMSAFEQFTDVNYNRFVKRSKIFCPSSTIINSFIYRKINVIDWNIPVFSIPLYTNSAILNVEEMATIFHFPNKDVATPNIMWLGARRAAAPVNTANEGLYLGKSVFRGVKKDIYMKPEDRPRHFYIVGQTGTGKSQFLMSLALQDIYNGEGVAIIDPHGSDINELLSKIPDERIEDVVFFDAADNERPMGMNLLQANTEEERHMAINFFIELLYKLYDPNHQGIMGPQLERALRNCMLTAMTDPQATLIDAMRLLIDDKYSQKFIDKVKDPLVLKYWDEIAQTTQNRKGETMGYFVSKLDRFVTDITLRKIIGQPKTTIDFDDIMANKKIFLADLSKGKIGEENSNFIGLLLVPKILMAALSRQKLIGKTDFPNFYLYVDEFQNFATDSFATILAEARKYKLNLTVAHQFIAQLEDKIKEAVFGNVGSKAVFRVSAEDAEYLETYLSPTFTKEDIARLPNGNCYMQLLVGGHPTSPFSMTVEFDHKLDTVVLPQNISSRVTIDHARAEKIKKISKAKYGTPLNEIEEFIKLRGGFDEKKEEVPPLPKLPF